MEEFEQRFDDYENWRTKLITAIESFQEWYDSQKNLDSHEELRLYELIDELKSDRLTIALIGEFSRGKTELINAIFFADYNRRLLPSKPGRTTMCPTEILYDEKLEPCIRLLPIESRQSVLTINELKKTNINWTTLPLNLDSADDMAESLQEILKCKTVTRRAADKLGLAGIAEDFEEDITHIEIPVWRHAVVNYPHRLLKQGLVILDTPGLNALGSEPELTLSMLPRAHAVLFVLAADTGVTKSDMDIWKNHVCVATHANAESRIAALNKIDTLWDDFHAQAEIDGFINRQAEETRKLLKIDRSMVFPVSAQKGLLGKIRGNQRLVSMSGLPKLESKLSEDIIVYKQKLIRSRIAGEIGTVVSASQAVVYNRMKLLRMEIKELEQLQGKSNSVIEDLAHNLHKQKGLFHKEVQSFDVTRRLLASQVRSLLSQLSLSRFDQLIARTRFAMNNSWTTAGLRNGVQTFFAGTFSDLKKVERQSEEIRQLVDEIYNRFHGEHGLPKMKPAKFAASTFMRRYRLLYVEAERFRNSPAMLVTEQHFVVKKFFITLVSRARTIFQECNSSARNWAVAVLTPIYSQIQEHKIMIDRRLDNLAKLRDNHASLAQRVGNIEQDLRDLKRQVAFINDILVSIRQPAPAKHPLRVDSGQPGRIAPMRQTIN